MTAIWNKKCKYAWKFLFCAHKMRARKFNFSSSSDYKIKPQIRTFAKKKRWKNFKMWTLPPHGIPLSWIIHAVGSKYKLTVEVQQISDPEILLLLLRFIWVFGCWYSPPLFFNNNKDGVLVCREVGQMVLSLKRYFSSLENILELFLLREPFNQIILLFVVYCALTSDTLPKLRYFGFTHFLDAVGIINHHSEAETISKLTVHSQMLQIYFWPAKIYML